MDRCPSELWTRIFGLACTDGGGTGRAIARTSRYFRAAVLPEQLYSVALRGTTKMSLFADFLERRAPAHRHVRHLFLTGRVPRALSKHNEIDGILLRIFRIVAPHLLSLANTMTRRPTARHQTLAFPRLTELTLNGYHLYHDTPSLRYLHVIFTSDERNAVYPCTSTHFRLPALSTMTPRLRAALKVVLALSDESVGGDTDPDGGELPLPSTVQGISIHSDDNREINDHTSVLRRADTDHQLEIRREMSYGIHSVQDEWEERITGGCGCWGAMGV